MTSEIRVPPLGESITEATVGKWLKQRGEAVSADEPVVELETDKVALEVPAPVGGVITELTANEGDIVAVNGLLGMIDPQGVATFSQASSNSTNDQAAELSDGGATPASPAARKMIAEAEISPDVITGSGKRNQVLKGDVIDFLATSSPNSASPDPSPTPQTFVQDRQEQQKIVPMTRLRLTIAKRLKEAQNTAAMLTTFNDIDMSAVNDLRRHYREAFEKKHKVRLGFMGFFVKACVCALTEFSTLNAEIDGNNIVYKNYFHIGVAVGSARGLVVPVVRAADRLSIAEIEAQIKALAGRAADGKLTIAEMQGGTFTITNGGVYGSLLSTPILNVPQTGILGIHRIEERPVVRNSQVVVRPMMYLALSYDHRLVDGKEAVSFLAMVKNLIEDPQRLILDV